MECWLDGAAAAATVQYGGLLPVDLPVLLPQDNLPHIGHHGLQQLPPDQIPVPDQRTPIVPPCSPEVSQPHDLRDRPSRAPQAGY